ncbi:MAG: Mu-like prophage major head subunit gpT family protein, partial [Thermoguttaceae bacterium]|nr:Mu-like prophage major head subunit gpT family protein [Thermoguttaceae bacterium]
GSAVSGISSGLSAITSLLKSSTGGRFDRPTATEIAEDGDPEYVIPVKKESMAVPLLRQLIGELSDSAYSVQAETFGKMYSLTRKDIINDYRGVFTELPRMIGFGASETLNKHCWTKFLNPANDADGKSFYHADHNNLKTSCALTLDNLSDARAQFIEQKKTKGAPTTGESPLGIQPTLLVVPTKLEDKALMLTRATWFNNGSTTDTPADYNPQRGRWTIVSSPYLSNPNFTGYSATTWYLLCDPRRLAAFEISFLNGKDSPTIERADADFDTEGVQFKGFIDFGISQQDYRAAMKCTA